MKLDWEVLELEPEHPFRIARSTERRVERVWVRVTADGREGWGEADPSPYYGESADTVVAALDAMRPVIDDFDDPEAVEAIERRLADRMAAAAPSAAGSGGTVAVPERRAPHASARAAVSAALHDLVGKRLARPLWRLWGLDPGEAPPSSFTLGIDEPDVMARKARTASVWPVLKVKLGLDDAEREEAILEAVRSEAPDATLRVDANAGWTADGAVDRIRRLAELGVEFVEQPLPPDDREGLRRIHETSPLPVVLDESCVTPMDVPALVGLADGVNVKLAKCGGPREALKAIHAARACGLRVMLGCMLGTTLGIAPAAHLAPLVDWADLDGAALLADDPFVGPGPVGPSGAGAAGGVAVGPTATVGRVRLGDGAGLGVERAG